MWCDNINLAIINGWCQKLTFFSFFSADGGPGATLGSRSLGVVLVAVADGTEFEPKKGVWIGLADTQFINSPILCRVRMLLSKGTTIRLAKRQKSSVPTFVEWHTLQGMVWSRTNGKAGKRDKWVSNIAYFCVMAPRTHCTGHCTGKRGDPVFPYKGGRLAVHALCLLCAVLCALCVLPVLCCARSVLYCALRALGPSVLCCVALCTLCAVLCVLCECSLLCYVHSVYALCCAMCPQSPQSPQSWQSHNDQTSSGHIAVEVMYQSRSQPTPPHPMWTSHKSEEQWAPTAKPLADGHGPHACALIPKVPGITRLQVAW